MSFSHTNLYIQNKKGMHINTINAFNTAAVSDRTNIDKIKPRVKFEVTCKMADLFHSKHQTTSTLQAIKQTSCIS